MRKSTTIVCSLRCRGATDPLVVVAVVVVVVAVAATCAVEAAARRMAVTHAVSGSNVYTWFHLCRFGTAVVSRATFQNFTFTLFAGQKRSAADAAQTGEAKVPRAQGHHTVYDSDGDEGGDNGN
jgi:hypothetical protein